MSTARNLPTPEVPLVFVADPDTAVQRSVKKLLAAIGARVEVFSTARDLLARLSGATPACVIAEARLPDQPGLDLLQALRGRGLDVPVILLSSDADVTSAVHAMRAGALDFIEKPYIDRALVAQVAPLLDVEPRRAH